MSISRSFAKQQIKRLTGIPFFPLSDTAVSELVDAVQQAPSETIAAKAISAFVDDSTATSRCPTAGDIKRAVQASAAERPRMTRCSVCGNSGFITVWRPVTYKPGTYQIKSAEALNLSMEEIVSFRAKLGVDQDILSAAKPCSCLPADHKLFTGERA